MFAVRPVNNTSHACSPIASSSHVQLNNSQISSNNYSALASSSCTQLRSIPIDPALIPIPDAADEDLSNAHSIAKAHGYSPVKKVAGARRSKGKQQAEATIQLGSRKQKAVPDLDDEFEAKPIKRGRPHGSGNYSQEDLKALLNLIEAELPLGQQGWIIVHSKFLKWARKHNRPDRVLKSIETKYKQVCA
jgi:hypothetical protein